MYKTEVELITQEVQDRIDQMNQGLISVTQFVICLSELDVHVSEMTDSEFIIMCDSDSHRWDALGNDTYPPRFAVKRP